MIIIIVPVVSIPGAGIAATFSSLLCPDITFFACLFPVGISFEKTVAYVALKTPFVRF